MAADARETIARAMRLMTSGDAPGAARMLETHLARAPDDVDALNALAGVRLRTGEKAAALALLERAAALKPGVASLHFNRGNLLAELGRFGEALAAYDAALALRPGHCDTVLNRARALAKLGRFDEALSGFVNARAFGADIGAALRGEGATLIGLARYEEALAAYDVLLARAPADLDALYNRGRCLYALDRFAESLAVYDAVLASAPDNAETWNARGVALSDLELPVEALQSFDKALALRPAHAETLTNRGLALVALGRAKEAVRAYDAALAGAANEKRAQIVYNKAMAQLAARDLPAGWDGFEARWNAGMINTPRRDGGEPAWRGEQVETLRVWPEQGVGDEVLFARLVPLAAQRAQRVVLECDARLVSFYARSFAGVEVCAVDGDAPRADAQCSLGSLGAALRVGLIELDDGAAYLKADGSRVAEIRARYEALAQGRPIIGVAWASKHPRRGAAKGAPIEEWGALLEREALFVNLQYGDVAGDVTRAEDLFGAAMHCDDTIDQMRDLDGFAAQIAALDHVVSISNTTVHIAGALGAPCILMAPPARGLLWYWGVAGEMTPWYRSVRIVRRALSASRSGQVADVARTLFP